MISDMDQLYERQTQRMQADREELAERIAQALPKNGRIEIQPGLFLGRSSHTTPLTHSFHLPLFCVIAQGAKALTLGQDTFRYDPAHYMISTVGVPMSSQVIEASPEEPFLNIMVAFDPALVSSVLVESGLAPSRLDTRARAVDVSPLDPELLNAVLRLLRLLERPTDYPVLAPLILREIIYRLLIGTQGGRMLHLAALGGQAQRMVQAVGYLRANFREVLSVEHLAKHLGMSLSGFHAHFKAVTAMSPLPFQKHLRLQEAQRLLLSQDLDAAEAGYRVGYEDASHFNRDYKRHFGEPPMRDVERRRSLLSGA